MNRIDAKFADLRGRRQKAFIPFLTAGDPDADTTVRILENADAAGADLIELGFPFSDPVADGPTIQASYTRALASGQNNEDVFRIVRTLRRSSDIPVVAMISYSLVFKMGFESFVERAIEAGLDGATIPDLPAEEMQKFVPYSSEREFNLISFITPATAIGRRKQLLSLARGFVYYIAVRGITGERKSMPEDLRDNLLRLKKETDLPVAVGFGISSPAQAQSAAALADAVIVGSAIVRTINETHSGRGDPVKAALKLMKELSTSVKNEDCIC